ncbi:MAG: K(+)-transporting ATPase subunit C [Smithellaceae bacterium]|nr:K(+)-transporting ATPase subunit C [Smithellaceae bacterium]
MIKKLIDELRISLIAVICLGIIVSGIYPLLVWAIGQGLFPEKADGSLITAKGKIVGSALIAQQFTSPAYFHPRPSAAGRGYDAAASGGSNLGPTSRQLVEMVAKRCAAYRQENGLAPEVVIPADAVTASASGLDPHISPANALLQAGRVARARGMDAVEIRRLIADKTEGRDLGLLGEKRINVLLLNLALDDKERSHGAR